MMKLVSNLSFVEEWASDEGGGGGRDVGILLCCDKSKCEGLVVDV
jgi:hypothetical protein